MPSKYQNFKIKSNIERKRREKEEDKRGKPGIRRQHHFSAHSLFCSPSRRTPLIDVLLFRSVGLVFQRLSAEIILAGEKGRGEEEGRSDEREEKKGTSEACFALCLSLSFSASSSVSFRCFSFSRSSCFALSRSLAWIALQININKRNKDGQEKKEIREENLP